MLDTGSLSGAFAGGRLHIYGGPSPETADDAVTGALLMTLTVDGLGGGLTFGPAQDGVISKSPSEVWKTTAVDLSGTISHFRFVPGTDTGTLSTTEARIQGTAGVAGRDMVLTTAAVVAGSPWALNYFSVALPTLG